MVVFNFTEFFFQGPVNNKPALIQFSSLMAYMCVIQHWVFKATATTEKKIAIIPVLVVT